MNPLKSRLTCLVLLGIASVGSIHICQGRQTESIDRPALVNRHCPIHTTIDYQAPLSVGNGEFAFTVDVTGLQTFAKAYEDTFPLGTKAQFGWHSYPNPQGYSTETYTLTKIKTRGRMIPYFYAPRRRYSPEAKWLEANPHSLHLGFVQLFLKKSDGSEGKPADLSHIRQKLDLWTGIIESRFLFDGQKVIVRTACHPHKEQIAIQIESPLFEMKQLGLQFFFPYASNKSGPQMVVYDQPDRHETTVVSFKSPSPRNVCLQRKLDVTRYWVKAQWDRPVTISNPKKHRYCIIPQEETIIFSAVVRFHTQCISDTLEEAEQTLSASKAYWETFWRKGGVVDLSASKDKRWFELERRIVLSQYLMAINCSGSLPPQETGLTHNSWFGSYHLEMYWVHAAHFPLWGHPELLTRSFPFYTSVIYKNGLQTAQLQGYQGVRWGKGLRGTNAEPRPNYIEPFLIWQQPHFLYFLELLYRRDHDTAVLKQYQQVWQDTADFMASYVHWNPERKCYELGPPIGTAQERSDHNTTVNPTFELAYWLYGLELAQTFRERLNLPRNEKWDHVIRNLPDSPVHNGIYLIAENELDTWTKPVKQTSHPSMLFAWGMLPQTRLVNEDIMLSTLDSVVKNWQWDQAWGWDFPFTAMTAARLGKPQTAIDVLMMDNPKNRFLKNGHSRQTANLLAYLPANGSLLTAIALMAAGWDGAPSVQAPGFPQDGQWSVKWEGLQKMP